MAKFLLALSVMYFSVVQPAISENTAHSPTLTGLIQQSERHGVYTFLFDHATVKMNSSCWHILDDLGNCSDQDCEALLEVKEPLVLQFTGHQLELEPKAVVLLKHQGKKVSIYNLFDVCAQSVVLTSGSAKTDVPVGEMLTMELGAVARAPATVRYDWALLAKASEVMRHSKFSHHKHDQRLWNNSLKTAACVYKVRGSVALEHMMRHAECYNKGTLKVR